MAAPDDGPAEMKGAPREREQASKRGSTRPAATEKTEQLIFTLRSTTGEVIRIEKIDSAGKRHEIRESETIKVAGKPDLDEIEAALDEAFEAGIFSVLDPERADETHEETVEEAELWRILLTLIGDRQIRRRLQRRII